MGSRPERLKPTRYDARVAALALTVMLTAVPARSQAAALDAAKCRAGAAAIAKSIGGTVGEQTDAVVAITFSYAPEIAYFCGPMSPTRGHLDERGPNPRYAQRHRGGERRLLRHAVRRGRG
jgi:hypothetical protein